MGVVGFPVFVRSCDLCNLPLLHCLGEARLGEDHTQTLTIVKNLVEVFFAEGSLAEAEPFLRDALQQSEGAQLQRFQLDLGSGSGVTLY